MFRPKGSGSARGGQITIDAYGTGDLPIIDALGDEAAIIIGSASGNQDYWTIQNIECRNSGSLQRYKYGIRYYGHSRILHNIFIRNNIVRNVSNSNSVDDAGIYVEIGESYFDPDSSHIDNVLIEGNQVYDVKGAGILFHGEYDQTSGMNWNNLSTNVIIRGNTITRTGRDGIITRGTDNVLIEGNRVEYSGVLGDATSSPCIGGIWPSRHKDGLIQFNEVAYTKRWVGDGQPLHSDICQAGTTTFQYNYTHDNEAGFFTETWKDPGDGSPAPKTIFRYNLSHNDGLNPDGEFIMLNLGRAEFY